MKKVLKIIVRVFFIILAGIILFFTTSWILSSKEVKDICSKITIEDSAESVISLVEHSRWSKFRDITLKEDQKRVITISSSASMGRQNCWVEIKDGKVVKTNSVFLD